MDFMIYNFISLFLIVLLKKLNDLGGKNMGLKIKLILKDGFYLSIGVFSIFLPIFVYFINSGGFKEVSGFVLSNIWQKNRHIPLPELKADTLIFYLPLIMLSFVFFKLVFYDLRSKVKNRIFWLTVFLLFSGIFFIVTLSGAPMKIILFQL